MKPKRVYIPERADVIWISLDPQIGQEQRGRRPALVLSPAAYNGRVGLVLLCPITSQVKGYPFEVALPDGLPVTGVVLADQVKSLDLEGSPVRTSLCDPRAACCPSVTKTQHVAQRKGRTIGCN